MSLSKKHFSAIASILRNVEIVESDLVNRGALAKRLADYFQGQKEDFNRERFLEQCEVLE